MMTARCNYLEIMGWRTDLVNYSKIEDQELASAIEPALYYIQQTYASKVCSIASLA